MKKRHEKKLRRQQEREARKARTGQEEVRVPPPPFDQGPGFPRPMPDDKLREAAEHHPD
jgi:hypothetical protein